MGVSGVPLEDLGALRHEVARGAEELPAVVPVKVPVELLVPIQVGGLGAAVLTCLLYLASIGAGIFPRGLEGQLSAVIYRVTHNDTKGWRTSKHQNTSSSTGDPSG